jgi:hypothetical protein
VCGERGLHKRTYKEDRGQSLRICDWRQGGYTDLHNLFFSRQSLVKPSFHILIFIRHSGPPVVADDDKVKNLAADEDFVPK